VLGVVAELDEGGTHDEQPRSAARYDGDIRLDHVAFRYPDAAEPVFHDLTLTIPQNRTTAFVGSSGAGKSTLLDLILGLQEPTSGLITCGGRAVQEDKASWYASLGVVPQDVFLTNDTVLANIAFGVEPGNVDETRVRHAVEQAQLSHLVAELPQGLNTVVGERGVRLSGGQRQRLGLARALYREPSVLILDEATSALDNVTERDITETLKGLSGNLTIVIVAHRLSTVRHADNLVFLQDGHIEAEGTFSSLRQQSVEFARLVELGDLR
jgi:ABC-type multidrug transport system fused ATPase/permease subunit